MYLMVVSVEYVESVIFGDACCSCVAQAPFSESSCCIAVFFEDLCDCYVLGSQGESSAVLPDGGVACVFSGHEDASCGGAYAAACEALSESHSLCCHSVDIGSFEFLAAHTGKLEIAQLVEHDVNDIRRRVRYVTIGFEAAGEGNACSCKGSGFEEFTSVIILHFRAFIRSTRVLQRTLHSQHIRIIVGFQVF